MDAKELEEGEKRENVEINIKPLKNLIKKNTKINRISLLFKKKAEFITMEKDYYMNPMKNLKAVALIAIKNLFFI